MPHEFGAGSTGNNLQRVRTHEDPTCLSRRDLSLHREFAGTSGKIQHPARSHWSAPVSRVRTAALGFPSIALAAPPQT